MRVYVLLTLATLFWAGNAIAGKLATGVISPVGLTFYRWLVACLVLTLLAFRQISADLPNLRAHAGRLFTLGAVGFAGFNLALYQALHHTTALNVTIEQSCMPVLVVLGSFLLYRERVSKLQLLGVAITIGGVWITASRGQPLSVLSLGLNRGDAIMLIGVLSYATYTLCLRTRPRLRAGSLLWALTLSATTVAAVFYAYEVWLHGMQWPGARGWYLIAYTSLLPSLLSQHLYIHGVTTLGENRAGLFINFVPVFGAILAVLILGEQLRPYHGVGLLLVLSGIALAERFRARDHRPPTAPTRDR